MSSVLPRFIGSGHGLALVAPWRSRSSLLSGATAVGRR
jgi:hypothetical protein